MCNLGSNRPDFSTSRMKPTAPPPTPSTRHRVIGVGMKRSSSRITWQLVWRRFGELFLGGFLLVERLLELLDNLTEFVQFLDDVGKLLIVSEIGLRGRS